MKTILVGYEDAAGKSTPIIILGLDSTPADQMALFSKAKTQHVFPNGFKRLNLCEVTERSIAVEIPSARAVLKNAAEMKNRTNDAIAKQHEENKRKHAEAAKSNKQKRADAQRSRLAFPQAAEVAAAENPGQAAQILTGQVKPGEENQKKEDTTMQNKTTTSPASAIGATAVALLAMLFGLLFMSPTPARAAEPVYAPQTITGWVQSANSTTNWLNSSQATNGAPLISAGLVRNVPFEIQVTTDPTVGFTNVYTLTPTASFQTNKLATNQNVTLTVTGGGGLSVYTWGTNLDAFGWGGWYLTASQSTTTKLTTNNFGYGLKKLAQ